MGVVTRLLAPLEEADHWLLPLQGTLVNRCIVDYAFSLDFQFESREALTLKLETPFTLARGKREKRFSPGMYPTELGSALGLFRKKVESAVAWKDGRLDVAFSGGIRLHASPDPQFEAWNLSGPRGLLMVCSPGGMITVRLPQ